MSTTGSGVVIVQTEVGADHPGALDEQGDGFEPLVLRGRDTPATLRWEAERRDRVDMLEPHVKRLAARDQQLDLRAVAQQPGGRRRGGRHLLEVVEQEQHLAIAQPIGASSRSDRSVLGHPDGTPDRDRHPCDVPGRRQVHE